MHSKRPAIIVISSHVVRGTVGNRAAAFALEVLGYPVWIVPTVTLPWHPGHGPAERITPSPEQFNQLIDNICRAPWLAEVGAVLSGYLGNKDQVEAVARLVDTIKTDNKNVLYAFDPVMGDEPQNNGSGRLYVPEQQAAVMKKQLLPRADILTPNCFELGWLTEKGTPQNLEEVQKAAESLQSPLVLTTSAPSMMKDHIGNLLVQNRENKSTAHLTEHRQIAGPPNGLGDLAAALMLGQLLALKDPVAALQKTTSSLLEVMSFSSKAQSDELVLEACIGSILNPKLPISARTLMNLKR